MKHLITAIVGTFICVVLFNASCFNNSFDGGTAPTPTPSAGLMPWTPSDYLGILPGKSTYNDVTRILGKPRSEGDDPESEMEKEPGENAEFDTLLQYSNGVEVVIGKTSNVVKEIGLYPDDMNRQQAVQKYGDRYFEVASGGSMCIKTDQKTGPSGEQGLRYPISLVYPEKGPVVTVREDNDVSGISFLYRCWN